jgi:hypothetical protein
MVVGWLTTMSFTKRRSVYPYISLTCEFDVISQKTLGYLVTEG